MLLRGDVRFKGLGRFPGFHQNDSGLRLLLLKDDVVVGRQNWLFFGSDAGGKTAAVVRSLIVSCQQAGVEPYAYLSDVLRRIADFPLQRIAELLPVNWMPATA